jgi:penicillin-binding protein 2
VFERRLKIFMALVFVVAFGLLCRLFDVTVIAHAYWNGQAASLQTRPQITETTRGRIRDFTGKDLAVDTACTDACVDYRAIIPTPDPKWVKELARARLKNRMGAEYTALKPDARKAKLASETNQVQGEIAAMWETLALLNPELNPADRAHASTAMDQIRAGIIQSVQARRQWVQVHNHSDAEDSTSGWLRYLANSTDADSDDTIAEETEPHVVLPALDSDACNLLGKHLEQLPGLVLRPSTHRTYPLKTVACHLLGRLSRVSPADLALNKRDNLDELREYLPSDQIGRDGIEGLCEPLLRGTRGKIQRRVSDDSVLSQQDFIPGTDLRLSIDSDLQRQAQELLQHVVEVDSKGVYSTPPEGVSMHGAVVVLDIKTNQVRVLASNPGFDVNDLQTRYPALAADLEQPLLNRATADPGEPGSTVKPLIGLGAITQGTIGSADTINCTGVLLLPGLGRDKTPRHVDGSARCWILSEHLDLVHAYQKQNNTTTIPDWAMHHELNFAQAIERSCDVYFETLADRMDPQSVSHWYEQFGVGRPTGIGIFERPGLRPEQWKGRPLGRGELCLAGMGQGKVLATPLQIANEAATIARGGIWMRPTLLAPESQAALDAVRPSTVPESIDLHLSPEALAQAKIGMVNVVDGPAGSGRLSHPGYTLAAKTGTAETSETSIRIKVRDAAGHIIEQRLQPVMRGEPETTTPWYRGSSEGKLVHGWFMGYAPVEDPQIAFCVLVQYAGAGGSVSAEPIAKQLLDACVRAGYLRTTDSGK